MTNNILVDFNNYKSSLLDSNYKVGCHIEKWQIAFKISIKYS